MQRRSAILGSLLFFFVAPATIAGLVPWGISHWRVQASFFGLALVRVAGASLIAIGVPVAIFLMFEKWFLVALPKGPIEYWLGF